MIKGSFFVISSSGSSCSPTLTGKSKICCDEDVAQYRHVSEFFILLYMNVPYNPVVQLIVTALPLCQSSTSTVLVHAMKTCVGVEV